MSARKKLPAHEKGSRNIFADLGLRMPRNTCSRLLWPIVSCTPVRLTSCNTAAMRARPAGRRAGGPAGEINIREGQPPALFPN